MNTMQNATDDEFPMPFSVYTRVTEVLSPFSGMGQIPEYILDEAKKRGNYVHDAITCIQQGLPRDPIIIKWEPYVDSYEQWARGKIFIKHPGRLFDDELKITGEPDCIYYFANDPRKDLYLTDFKTSAIEGSTWKYQGAAYEYLAKRKGYDIKGIEFVKLDKNGNGAHSYCYENTWFQGFLWLLSFYREFFEGKKGAACDLGDI